MAGLRPSFLIPSLLLLSTLIIYVPAMRGSFLWDDDAYISQNDALLTTKGLQDIWFKPGTTQQYYPATFTVFWVERHLWGLNPLGYHLANVLFHATNAMLIWIILTQLEIPGAALAAFFFALHPVEVESVAWMTELKNVLSTFFYLSTVWLLLAEKRRTFWTPHYIAALACFAAALLSKSITLTLPISFLFIHRWMKGHWQKEIILKMIPMMVMGTVMAGATAYYEHHLVGAQGTAWSLTLLQRMLISSHAFWFYLKKLIYPSPLLFIYPRWSLSPLTLIDYLYPMLALILLMASAGGTRWWGKLPFACLLFFTLSLAPALGLTSFYFMRFSFVADHFQYLASIGIFTLAAFGLWRFLDELGLPPTSILGGVVISLLCVNMALASLRQSRYYVDSRHLWEHTLEGNPDSAIAHHNLGIAFAHEQKWNDALPHLRMAEALDPSFPQTHLALAYFWLQANRIEDSRYQYQEAIRLGIRDPQVLKDYAMLPKPHATQNR